MGNKFRGVLFILILGSFCTALLVTIKSVTYPQISRNREIKLKTSILEVAGLDYNLNNFEEIFEKNIRTVKKKGFVYYLTSSGHYIFQIKGRGLWGPIEGVIALAPDLETIDSISIISQEETPGLGGRISEESFLDQFKNKRMSPYLVLALRRKATKENEVDAISGATITSGALLKIINEQVDKFRRIIRE